MTVTAVEGRLAARATKDLLRRSVVARHVDELWLPCQDLDAVERDQRVDDEGAARLPLAIEAMAAVHEERIARQSVANGSACAATLADHTPEPTRAPTYIPAGETSYPRPPAPQPELPPLLLRPGGLAAGRPGRDHRAPADGGARAARERRSDGRAHDRLPPAEPPALPPRGRLGRPQRPAA